MISFERCVNFMTTFTPFQDDIVKKSTDGSVTVVIFESSLSNRENFRNEFFRKLDYLGFMVDRD